MYAKVVSGVQCMQTYSSSAWVPKPACCTENSNLALFSRLGLVRGNNSSDHPDTVYPLSVILYNHRSYCCTVAYIQCYNQILFRL